MDALALSKNGIPIRLPSERWHHVLTDHPELTDRKADVLEAVSNPEYILEGNNGELLAVREIQPGKWLVVVYREFTDDGFTITAFLTRRSQYLNKRRQLWP